MDFLILNFTRVKLSTHESFYAFFEPNKFADFGMVPFMKINQKFCDKPRKVRKLEVFSVAKEKEMVLMYCSWFLVIPFRVIGHSFWQPWSESCESFLSLHARLYIPKIKCSWLHWQNKNFHVLTGIWRIPLHQDNGQTLQVVEEPLVLSTKGIRMYAITLPLFSLLKKWFLVQRISHINQTTLLPKTSAVNNERNKQTRLQWMAKARYLRQI